jgi:hypothetical protein
MITIFVKYVGFGWLASSPDSTAICKQRHAGQRAAAEELGNAHFGAGKYTLTKSGPRSFQAEVKP